MSALVLIPAYNPDEKLVRLVDQLRSRSFDILIVNDGSRSDCAAIFEQCAEQATVIGYDDNRGKGSALKTGMRYIKEHMPEQTGFITADADGQHSIDDICKVRDSLENGADFVLSVRKLRRDAPLRSRVGNTLSRFLYANANAHYLPDNQSGLRGFNIKHLDWMQEVRGDKYDYEMNVLLFAEKQGIKFTRIPIQTIYFDNNAGSHFSPIKDTILIYVRFFETYLFSIIGTLIGIGLLIVSEILWGRRFMAPTLYVAWGIKALLTLVIERYTLFRRIRYTPGVRRLIFSIFLYTIYGLILFALGFFLPGIPMAVDFVLALIMTAFGEYFVLKISYE